jgi:hypothetical protein
MKSVQRNYSRSWLRIVAAVVCLFWLTQRPTAAPAAAAAGLEYAGSDRCQQCHQPQYDGWKQTFHATAVQDARKDPSVIQGDFTASGLPFTREEVEYVIGGHRDERYMKKIGDDYYILPRSWSVQSHQWREYNKWGWKKVPYSRNCKGCHVTAYDPDANVPVAEDRIGCESCHGPGWVHAESDGDIPILPMKELTLERRNMICASCHVRGKDLSGTYLFPIGYMPGEDLGDYYVPDRMEEGETNTQAINRLFGVWEEKRARGGRQGCDACAIPGMESARAGAKDDSMQFCFSCHNFKARYAEHTRHGKAVDLHCFDCHVQKKTEIMNVPTTKDIHSPDYFLVHAENCYDPNLETSCLNCHGQKGIGWARTWVSRWRDPSRSAKIEH